MDEGKILCMTDKSIEISLWSVGYRELATKLCLTIHGMALSPNINEVIQLWMNLFVFVMGDG